jgi:hypothetical protein
MKWSVKDVEKPWIADYIKQELTKVGDTYPVFKLKESEKGGLFIEVEEFKVYLFPNSQACEELKKYLNDSHDTEIEGIQIVIIDYYPYFELNDETATYVHVHYQDNGTITLTPSPVNDTDNARKVQVNVGKKRGRR